MHMPLIAWNSAYSTGIQKIDEQHIKFFSLINTLFDALQAEQNRKVVGAVLKELQEYVMHHFTTEESWMKLYNYPNLDDHKLEHEEAVKKVNKLVLEYERDYQTVDIDLLKFLSEWLKNHILQVDMKYIPYFRGKI
jgi:hemerythrin-like metal-binding protein